MPQSKSVRCSCERCGFEFFATPCDVRRGRSRFCGRSCASKATAPRLPTGWGERNPNWKGGFTKSSKGYWYVKLPQHPRADAKGYVKQADLVLEKELGRPLQKGEIAHHKNENKSDDSPDNLEAMLHGQHTREHHPSKPFRPKNPDAPTNRRYNWPTAVELLRWADTNTVREIASMVGCSFGMVGKKLRDLRKKQQNLGV